MGMSASKKIKKSPKALIDMEDIIALQLRDGKKGKAAFMTWGRVFDRVDTTVVESKIAKVAEKFGFRDVKSVAVCDSLQEVSHYPYFYEALVSFAWKPIPFGKNIKCGLRRRERKYPQGKRFISWERSTKNSES